LFQAGGVNWILYNGTKVIIYDGKFGFEKKSKKVSESNGTSGALNHQIAKEQIEREKSGNPGPVPEGNYKINLQLDPDRLVKFDPATGLSNQGWGIQKIPKITILNDGRIEDNWTYWGTIRARLEKDPGHPTIVGDNYYLHDSDKGATHGCIECSKTKIFNTLLKFRSRGLKSIRVKIKYPSPETITNGGPHGK
jgi:hypothetical protein